MLVPHFSQMWFFLTPPTDVVGLGMLGDSFPGNRRAASEVAQTNTQTNTAAHRDVLAGASLSVHHINTLLVFTALCQQSVFVSPICQQYSSAPAGHASWNECRHIGYYYIIAIWIYLPHHLLKQKMQDRYIPWFPYGSHRHMLACSVWCTFNRDGFKMVPGNISRRRYELCCIWHISEIFWAAAAKLLR